MGKMRYFRGFLTIMVCIFALPLIANAESTTLPDAVDDVITLTDDVTLSSYTIVDDEIYTSFIVEEDETITIDLNGYTLTTSYAILVNGSLTIKDSASGGEFITTKGYSVAVNGSDASFTLENGTITNNKTYGIYCLYGGTATISGGTITSVYAPLSGNNTTGDMNFYINGGTITATYGPAIYMSGQVNLAITDGTINGGISLRMGIVTISGGTINAMTNDSYIDSIEEYYNYNGNVFFDSALYVIGGTYTSNSGNDLVLTITGGTFNTTNSTGSAVTIYDLGKVEQSMTINITGGTFNTSNADEAFSIVKFSDIGVDDSTYGVYEGNVSATITGGTFSTDVNLDYVPSTYVVTDNSTYYVVEAQTVTADAEEIDTTATVTEVTVGVTSTEDLDEVLSEALASSDLETDNINVSVSIDMETIDELDTDVDAFKGIGSVVSSLSSDAVIASYFDITINVTDADSGESIGTLTNLSSAISFTILLPDDLQTVADGYTRTYYVVRYHEGTAELIDATLSDDGTYVTFESDKFSTYALAYVDNETATTTNTDNPQTGDNWIMYIGLGVVAAGGIIYLTAVDSKKKKSK